MADETERVRLEVQRALGRHLSFNDKAVAAIVGGLLNLPEAEVRTFNVIVVQGQVWVVGGGRMETSGSMEDGVRFLRHAADELEAASGGQRMHEHIRDYRDNTN